MNGRQIQTDAELLNAARHDPEAFAVFYDRYARAVTGWARRGGIPESDVLDLVGELFAQAWQSRRRYRDPGSGSAGPWLHGIARHLIARYHRRNTIEDRARKKLGMMTAVAADPLELVDERLDELRRRPELANAISRLPPSQAQAVRLRVLDEHDYAEIARCLACTPATARKHVSLALQSLRSILNAETTR
jgi:RNA polymerase sigma factor (sigma-70 family)